jgi:alkylated DNA nucleotide flippase Atl1
MDNGDQLLSSNIPVGLVTSKGQISRVTGMTKRLSSRWVELEED